MQAENFDPIEYLERPDWRHASLGLGRTSRLLELLGNPESSLRTIHVAGTNGKGSVCAFIASALICSGLKCGLYTSPAIEKFNERISVDGTHISDVDLKECVSEVAPAAKQVEDECGQHPTEFELACAVAFVYFKRKACDICVVEVGLGGRLDATNVISPELSIITKVSLDHCAILGSTLSQIAAEKAGIIKKGVPCLSYPQDPSAQSVIENACNRACSKLYVSDFSCLEIKPLASLGDRRHFSYRDQTYETLLRGRYSCENAALAIDALRILDIPKDCIKKGIASTRWPGRFEILGQNPDFIVDGAHNPDACLALSDTLREILDAKTRASKATSGKTVFMMGVLSDKDYPAMISALAPHASAFVTYTPANPRALEADALAQAISEIYEKSMKGSENLPIYVALSVNEAVRLSVKLAGRDDLIVACGTLYSIAEIKRAYQMFKSGSQT